MCVNLSGGGSQRRHRARWSGLGFCRFLSNRLPLKNEFFPHDDLSPLRLGLYVPPLPGQAAGRGVGSKLTRFRDWVQSGMCLFSPERCTLSSAS